MSWQIWADQPKRLGMWTGALVSLAAAPALAAEPVQLASADDLGQLSIEQLANVEIISVSRRPEPVRQAPAAIYVITNDDIRRAGARSLPEALGLAPNLQVARANAGTYAITARGFNHSTSTANKLQVLIDGRSVYTPLYSGVFWDAQNVMLEDIDRIEVISGPGGTLWGANAVNGVINIVTRSAHETEGTLLAGGVGEHNTTLSLRHGGQLPGDGAFRIYGTGSRRGPSDLVGGGEARDEWENLQAGFRTDWGDAGDTITLQGDIYNGSGEDVPGQVRSTTISGGNLLGRWSHRFDDDSSLSVQAYYDRARRTVSSGIVSEIDTYAAEAQYNFSLGERHNIVLGGGMRINEDRFIPGPGTVFVDPAERTLRLGQLFAQDTYAVADNLDLIVGLKLEHNSYTGMEYMPNARIAWRLSNEALAWAAVSRAVRTPSRFDSDLYNSGIFAGGPNFASEYLTAYEIGYRAQPTPRSYLSISTYYNVYDDLRTVEASTPAVFPLIVANGMSGDTYGVEIWGDYSVTDWWRLSAGVNVFRKELELDAGSLDVFGIAYAGNDPDYQLTLRSLMNLNDRTELDLNLRAVDDLPSPAIPSYVELDARLGWRVNERAEISLAGYNLLDENHAEFSSVSPQQILMPRSVMLATRWRF